MPFLLPLVFVGGGAVGWSLSSSTKNLLTTALVLLLAYYFLIKKG